MKYNDMTEKQKEKLIKKMYCSQKKSFAEIAKYTGTYPNRVRSDAVSLGIQIRTRSDAAKAALESGRAKHPTKGLKRSDETKLKNGLINNNSFYVARPFRRCSLQGVRSDLPV